MATAAQRKKARDNLPSAMRKYIIDPTVVYGFTGALLSPRFDNPKPTPDFHIELWENCCRSDPRVAIAAPRGHAKSTAVTHSFILACALFMKKRNIMILSDTEEQARAFLGDIKVELTENTDLMREFQITHFLKDNGKELIVMMGEHGYVFRIFARGMGQSLRGAKWRGMRPDLIVGDDIENDELVENPDRRLKMKRWMMSALLPMISADGHVRLVGTILHYDSYLENILRSSHWTTKRYEAHDDNFEHILWPEQYNKEWLQEKYEHYKEQGQEDLYYQEYRNIPIDPKSALIRREDLLALEDAERKAPGTYYITVDLAISDKNRADYSVFLIWKILKEGTLCLAQMIRGRFDSPVIIDTIFSLQSIYKPDMFVFEGDNIQKAIMPIMNVEMMHRGIFPHITVLTSSKDLIARSWDIRARIRTRMVKFDKEPEWWPTVEHELVRFPRAKHDDIVAAASLMGRILDKTSEPPTQKELDEQDFLEAREPYEEDYEENYTDQGFCVDTGY